MQPPRLLFFFDARLWHNRCLPACSHRLQSISRDIQPAVATAVASALASCRCSGGTSPPASSPSPSPATAGGSPSPAPRGATSTFPAPAPSPEPASDGGQTAGVQGVQEEDCKQVRS